MKITARQAAKIDEEVTAVMAKYAIPDFQPGDITVLAASGMLGVGPKKAVKIMEAAPEFESLRVKLSDGKMARVWRLKKRGKISKTKE